MREDGREGGGGKVREGGRGQWCVCTQTRGTSFTLQDQTLALSTETLLVGFRASSYIYPYRTFKA